MSLRSLQTCILAASWSHCGIHIVPRRHRAPFRGLLGGAIAAPTAFPAAAAPSLEGWLARDGQTSDTIYLGDLTSTRARGNYYLTTNPSPLFGRGPSGLRPDDNQARRRRASTLTRLLKYLR
ncbi:uncharacterized protein LOC135072780 [Ostrinia nubilalis]|uniref:uncharacterized protein LOC135072780 n=1 Tax=Ostrinia nubilalis TaxID=29057 RepID=UPI003082374A